MKFCLKNWEMVFESNNNVKVSVMHRISDRLSVRVSMIFLLVFDACSIVCRYWPVALLAQLGTKAPGAPVYLHMIAIWLALTGTNYRTNWPVVTIYLSPQDSQLLLRKLSTKLQSIQNNYV